MSNKSRLTMVLGLAGLIVMGSAVSGLQAASLNWEHDYEKAKKTALKEGKPMLAMFTASWCGPCKRMKASTLSDRSVEKEIAANFVPVMIDTDRNPGLTRKFGVRAMPTMTVIDPRTEDAESERGYLGTRELISFMNRNKMELPVADDEPMVVEKGNGKTLTEYCLVTAVEEGKLVQGQEKFQAEKDGFKVSFASADKKEKFEANPEKFWPQLSGNCPVHLAKTGKLQRGEARWVIAYDGELFMCDSKGHAEDFIQSPTKYIDQAKARIGSLKKNDETIVR